VKFRHDEPLGAECAWPVPPKSSAADRVGLALIAILLAISVWLLVFLS